MSCIRFLEIILFVLFSHLPYDLLSMYVFRGKFKYSLKIIVFIMTGVVALDVAKECFVVCYGINASISTLITAISGIIIMKLITDERIEKLFMITILVINLSVLLIYLGKFTEGILFYENSLQSNRWSSSLCTFLWEIPIFYLLIRYMDRMIIPTLSRKQDDEIWRYLWTVPTTFLVIWNVYLAQFPYFAEGEMHDRLASLFVIIVISAGSFVIYHVTFLLLGERTKNETYAEQYVHLNSMISEAKKARHDVRHHLVMIDAFLVDGKIEELKEYLKEYRAFLPMEEVLTFCDHYVSNAILTYTKQQANMSGIECNIVASYPSEMPIGDQDLTIIMGNLLENALDACRRDLEENPDFRTKIEVKGKYDGNSFIFSVKNSSLQLAVQNEDEQYISSKRKKGEVGIGVNSVQSIVKKYRGNFLTNQSDGMFTASVVIVK